jgi:hypothetical protein
LYELTSWLSAFADGKCFSLEGLPQVCDIIKKNADKLSPMSQELMTAVRVVRMLCSEPKTSGLDTENLVSLFVEPVCSSVGWEQIL